MKKTIALLLALLMLFGMAACSKKAAESAPAAAPTAAPTSTPAPTAAPTNTPAPTEVPAEVLVTNALAKLDDLKSMHMDMTVLMDMTINISYQGMNMNMSILKVSMDYLMDIQKDPYMTKMDLKMDIDAPYSYIKQSLAGLIYVDMSGETPVGYSTEDGGATWTVETEGLNEVRPQESYGILTKYAKDFEKVGPDTVDGKAVTVYRGKLDSKYAQEILSTTGMEDMLKELTGGDTAEGAPELKDILVTVSVDDETGYPVHYIMDMSDMMKDVLAPVMKQAMSAGAEGADITLDAVCALSQFDSVEPIVIPEAALAANNN